MSNPQKTIILSDDILKILADNLDLETNLEIARWYKRSHNLDGIIKDI